MRSVSILAIRAARSTYRDMPVERRDRMVDGVIRYGNINVERIRD